MGASRVRRVALTGGIATGKSYVRRRLEALGIPTIDADTLAREAVAPGTPGLTRVVERFGPEVLDASGQLDRERLAGVVFANAALRGDLERIIHPYVRQAMDRWFDALDPNVHPLAVADIPLLFETGRQTEFEDVIVVAVDPETQVQRVMERDGLPETLARQRIAAQLPIAAKVERAGYVIDTGGAYPETDAQIDEVVKALRASAASH